MSKTTLLIRASLRGVQKGHYIGSCWFEGHVLIFSSEDRSCGSGLIYAWNLCSPFHSSYGTIVFSLKMAIGMLPGHTSPIPGPSYLDLLSTNMSLPMLNGWPSGNCVGGEEQNTDCWLQWPHVCTQEPTLYSTDLELERRNKVRAKGALLHQLLERFCMEWPMLNSMLTL